VVAVAAALRCRSEFVLFRVADGGLRGGSVAALWRERLWALCWYWCGVGEGFSDFLGRVLRVMGDGVCISRNARGRPRLQGLSYLVACREYLR
jgi:hypothetical protein